MLKGIQTGANLTHLLHQSSAHHLLPQCRIKAEVVQQPQDSALQLLATPWLQQRDQLGNEALPDRYVRLALLHRQQHTAYCSTLSCHAQ